MLLAPQRCATQVHATKLTKDFGPYLPLPLQVGVVGPPNPRPLPIQGTSPAPPAEVPGKAANGRGVQGQQ